MAQAQDLDKLRGDHKMKLSQILKRSWKYVKKEVWWLLLSLFFITVCVGIDVVLPRLTMLFVDYFDALTANSTFSILLGIVIGYIGLSLANQVIMYFQSMILQKAGQRIVYALRMEVFEHIERMSQNQFNEMPVGSLVTRVANYTASMSDLFTDVLVILIRDFLTAVIVFIIMLFLSIKLSLFLLAFTLVAGVISYVFGHIVGKIFRRERQYISDLNTFLSENLSGMKIIQVFNQERRKQKEFDEKNWRLRRARYNVIMVSIAC